MKSPILLIDGDQFIYKCTAALEKETRWDDQNHVLYSNVEECWTNVRQMVKRIFDRFSSTEHALCFSQGPYFRTDLCNTYKSGRQQRKPLCFAELYSRVQTEYNCLAFQGLEADDVMGILATKPNAQRKIIVSQDKDMKSIPGQVWDGKDLHTITEAEADYQHMYQTLVGDRVDGYLGCPGVGAKGAEKLLANVEDEPRPLWPRVVEAFTDANLTEADALLQARLARILRWSDWDYENKRPILWSPNASTS